MADNYEIPKEGASIDTEYSSKKNKARNIPGSGVYRHKESGQVAIVQFDPLWGNTQAQAFARVGFVFEREARADEIKSLPEIAMEARQAEESTLKGLSARLDRMEDANAKSEEALKQKLDENKALADEVAELRAQLAEAKKAESVAKGKDTKAAKIEKKEADAAAESITKAGASQVSDAQSESADKAKTNAEQATDERESATGTTQESVAGSDK